MCATQGLLLEVKDLRIPLYNKKDGAGVLIPIAENGINLTIHRGRTLSLVGDSGPDLSALCRAIATYLRQPGLVASGRLVVYPARRSQFLRDPDNAPDKPKENHPQDGGAPELMIALIAQEPIPTLSRLQTIGGQMVQAVQINHKVGKPEARRRAMELLAEAGIERPRRLMNEYPINLPEEIRLRVILTMALASEPALLIIDDPDTMLDLPNRAQIFDRIAAMQQETNMAVLCTTRSLGLAEQLGDDIAVMYQGAIIETANVQALFSEPEHPYTQALIEGQALLPQVGCAPFGCSYRPICPHAMPCCAQWKPRMVTLGQSHDVRCFLPETRAAAPQDPMDQHPSDSDIWQLERFLMR